MILIMICLANLFRSILLVSILVTMASPLVAGELSLLINGKAIHLGDAKSDNLNENNWGAGLQYDYEIINNKWVPFSTVSAFKDSNRESSFYVGGGIMRRYMLGSDAESSLHFDAGLVGFLMTRKDYRDREPFLGILPAFSVGNKNVAVNITYIPKVDPKLVPLWFFQLKVSTSIFD